ncbi:C39 family peptidase [Luteimonas colneyensis]|uniref:C39 family peptidase n=1 Tax=Luteimonas colneyensis TaxID=2762230 RepID=UPI00296ABECA|nr:C39 family peptidase [Luteimonas colneyensis]
MTQRRAAAWTSLLAACLAWRAAAPDAAHASTAEVRVPHGGSYAVPVTSLKAARYRTTVPQQHDFSCGSAAVATLLTFQYGHPVGEAEVFRHMYARGDQARIRREGFSLLDMRAYLEAQGYSADGFEVPLDRLLEEGLPAIVLLNDRGYRHFVVVKGMRAGRVLVGDPARGTRLLPRRQFDRLWDNRVLFVVHNRRELAAFNDPRDWRLAPLAPLADAIQRQGLQDVVLGRRGPGDI